MIMEVLFVTCNKILFKIPFCMLHTYFYKYLYYKLWN